MAANDWAPVASAPTARDDWAPVGQAGNLSPGERQASADEALTAKERGYIPDEVKAATYSGLNTALIGVPTHAMALVKSYSENLPYKEALAKEREYEAALERQNPVSSHIGTGLGLVGSFALPIGPLGAAGAKAAQLAGRAGAGALGKAAASGATIGAEFGGLSGISEKYGTDEFTPAGIAKSAAIGGLGGAALGPAAEAILGRGVSPEHAARAALLESQGIAPSRQMITGVAAPEGAASKVAEEMTAKAKDVLEQKRQSLMTPSAGPDVGAESLQAAARQSFKESQAPYKTLETMPESFKFGAPGAGGQGILPFAEKDLQNAFKSQGSAYEYIQPFVQKRLDDINVNPKWRELTGNYPGANDASNVLNIHLGHFDSLENGPTFADILEAKKKLGESYRLARTTDDRKAVQGVIDGYKNAINQAVIDGLFTGDKTLANTNLTAADAGWAKYRQDFNPKQGAEATIFKNVMGKMVDPNTGYLAKDLTPEMAQAAQGVIDANILDPSKNIGPALYARLQQTIGADTPAMANFNAAIKNKMFTPKDGNIDLLPKQIAKYTDPSILPISLQAFGANKDGNLRTLASHASDSAETTAAKRQLLDLQNMGKAIDIVNARPSSDETKKSLISAILKKAFYPLAGASIGIPHGIEPLVGMVAGHTVGEVKGGVSSLLAAKAQRAGAPKTQLVGGQGFNAPIGGGKVYPVVKDLSQLAPPDKEPNYQMPQPLPRKSGGRVSDHLVRAVDRAKKNINKGTEVLLNTPDSHVAHALEVAKRNFEG